MVCQGDFSISGFQKIHFLSSGFFHREISRLTKVSHSLISIFILNNLNTSKSDSAVSDIHDISFTNSCKELYGFLLCTHLLCLEVTNLLACSPEIFHSIKS
jgi:hypothetical protein